MEPSVILDIIIIIYYVPALLIAIYAGLKHGFSRSAGWFNLNLLSLFRLVGSALGIAAVYKPSQGVGIASVIFSSIGTISLLGALLGLIGRINESLGDKALLPRFARFLHLITLTAMILAIVGGIYAYGSNFDKREEGHRLVKGAIVLLIIIYVVVAGIDFHTFTLRSLVPVGERRLLHVSLLSLPFVLVRLILAICSAWLYNSSVFALTSTSDSAIVVKAIMGVLMEFIVVGLFLWAGCTVDRSVARDSERAQKQAANGKYKGQYGMVEYDRVDMQRSGNVHA